MQSVTAYKNFSYEIHKNLFPKDKYLISKNKMIRNYIICSYNLLKALACLKIDLDQYNLESVYTNVCSRRSWGVVRRAGEDDTLRQSVRLVQEFLFKKEMIIF